MSLRDDKFAFFGVNRKTCKNLFHAKISCFTVQQNYNITKLLGEASSGVTSTNCISKVEYHCSLE